LQPAPLAARSLRPAAQRFLRTEPMLRPGQNKVPTRRRKAATKRPMIASTGLELSLRGAFSMIPRTAFDSSFDARQNAAFSMCVAIIGASYNQGKRHEFARENRTGAVGIEPGRFGPFFPAACCNR
jgi:hypothetical protein